MVYGAIDEKSREWYTYLPELFDSIGNAQLNYNWLITDSFCNIGNPVQDMVDQKSYCWISGEALTKLVQENHIQWIWAVLCGFAKNIPLENVLKYPLPWADGYGDFWRRPISMQHPLATMEIVPWDSSLVLFFSREKDFVDQFMHGYPESEELAAYIARQEENDDPA